MNAKKKAAPERTPTATSNNNYTIIHPKKKSKGGKGQHHTRLTIQSTVYSIAIKVCDEQLPKGWEYTCEQIRKYPSTLQEVENQRDTYSAPMEILAIKHDRGILKTSDFWLPSYEKFHGHIILRILTGKRMRIGAILKIFGIEFRKGLDDKLLENGALEHVNDFPGYAQYLTHKTEKAIAEGKEPYDASEFISNLPQTRVEELCGENLPVVNVKRRFTKTEWAQIDAYAYQLGYNLKDFDEFYNAQPFIARSNPKIRAVKESYQQGVKARFSENPQVTRLCVYICGPPNTGKTYAAEHAVPGSHLRVGGGGTGKFDNLSPSTNAIIVDDDNCPNLLNMSDNYFCPAYRRVKNNPIWAGDHLVITSNLQFEEFLEEKCGIHVEDEYGNPSQNYEALRSRFYICEIAEKDGYSYLKCIHSSKRGTPEEQKKRLDMFNDFKNKFDQIIAGYRPSEIKHIDYSSAHQNPMAGKPLEQTKPEESSTPNEQCEQPAHKEISTTDEPFEQAELEKTPVVAEPYKQPKPEEIPAATEPCEQPAPKDLLAADAPCEEVEQLTISNCLACDDSPADEPQEQAKPEKIPLNPNAPVGDLRALAKMFSEQLSDTDAVVDIRD